jgi:hypothetical protein
MLRIAGRTMKSAHRFHTISSFETPLAAGSSGRGIELVMMQQDEPARAIKVFGNFPFAGVKASATPVTGTFRTGREVFWNATQMQTKREQPPRHRQRKVAKNPLSIGLIGDSLS